MILVVSLEEMKQLDSVDGGDEKMSNILPLDGTRIVLTANWDFKRVRSIVIEAG